MGKQDSVSERRQETRYQVAVPIGTDDCFHNNDALFNLSMCGACFKTPEPYEAGDMILLNFFFTSESLCMPARIRWKKTADAQAYTYGVEFFCSHSTFFISQRRQFMEHLSTLIVSHAAEPIPE
ncbi:MAG: PilZ domain-containing protein [Chitinivibrionales bacterium]|nr:PilZ domain-containing protein [Chitinivibrionales bacterium]